MTLKTVTFIISIVCFFSSNAQSLSEIKNKRVFEHHSSLINNNNDFGENANGIQSGYDFINHTYYFSYNKITFGPYTNGEELNLDLVEHNGPFGNGGNFGFTSGTSSIWDGDIKGNNITLWIKAPASFDYNSATTLSDLKLVFESGVSSNSIETVDTFTYIGKIRGGVMYVALKCFQVNNTNVVVGKQNVFFDFDYKYGVSTVGVSEANLNKRVLVYPNPAYNFITIMDGEKSLLAGFTIINSLGISMAHLTRCLALNYDVSQLAPGVYFIVSDETNQVVARFVK